MYSGTYPATKAQAEPVSREITLVPDRYRPGYYYGRIEAGDDWFTTDIVRTEQQWREWAQREQFTIREVEPANYESWKQ